MERLNPQTYNSGIGPVSIIRNKKQFQRLRFRHTIYEQRQKCKAISR